MDSITAEWLNFAKTMEPAASTMTTLALADHARPILLAIAKDLEQDQTDQAQYEKSKGNGPSLPPAMQQKLHCHGIPLLPFLLTI